MIGVVSGHHATVSIPFRLLNQPQISVEAVIDTGFTGYLTLPPAAVTAMRLPFIRRIPANLANDTTISIDVHEASILWNDVLLDVEVLAMGKRPLVGTLLLDGCKLHINFVESGLVSIATI